MNYKGSLREVFAFTGDKGPPMTQFAIRFMNEDNEEEVIKEACKYAHTSSQRSTIRSMLIAMAGSDKLLLGGITAMTNIYHFVHFMVNVSYMHIERVQYIIRLAMCKYSPWQLYKAVIYDASYCCCERDLEILSFLIHEYNLNIYSLMNELEGEERETIHKAMATVYPSDV